MVVPVENSIRFAERHRAEHLLIHGDHGLNGQIALIDIPCFPGDGHAMKVEISHVRRCPGLAGDLSRRLRRYPGVRADNLPNHPALEEKRRLLEEGWCLPAGQDREPSGRFR
jgi:hypothetical protein